MIRQAIVILLLTSLAAAQSTEKDWAAVQRFQRRDGFAVSLRDGRVVRGRLQHWTVEAIDLSSTTGVEHFGRQNVAAIRIEMRGSRKKAALWGALIGFGAAFPVGVASAGYLTDRNNPPLSTRAGTGLGFGLLGAGIGAGLGSLGGGSHTLTIYRAR